MPIAWEYVLLPGIQAQFMPRPLAAWHSVLFGYTNQMLGPTHRINNPSLATLIAIGSLCSSIHHLGGAFKYEENQGYNQTMDFEKDVQTEYEYSASPRLSSAARVDGAYLLDEQEAPSHRCRIERNARCLRQDQSRANHFNDVTDP